jgi:hypothetical protein
MHESRGTASICGTDKHGCRFTTEVLLPFSPYGRYDGKVMSFALCGLRQKGYEAVPCVD